MSSANRDFLTISLPICIPFVSFSCFITLAKYSRIMLNRSGEIGHPCLVPDFRGNGFSFSPLSMMLAVRFSYLALVILSYIPSIPSFLRAFYHEMVFNLMEGLFCIYWDDQMFFVFGSIKVLFYVKDLRMLNHPCICGMKLTLSW
jgi:hypothetical protein